MNIVTRFRQLHRDASPLKLANAWDAGSARMIESLGARAVATTSAGVAWAMGYQDGRQLPVSEMIATVRRIIRVLSVPLSVDMENGYSDDPQTVANNVMQLVDLGVAGINIEDGHDTPSILAAKIEAIRRAVTSSGADLFINARCDVYLAHLVEEKMRSDESICRGRTYASAGADGLFLPGLAEPTVIAGVAGATQLPLNVMAWPGLPDAETLGTLGVRRLSAGSAISQTVFGKMKALAEGFLRSGESSAVSDDAMSYADIQSLFQQ
ncbi:isocitrate lyase/phosphoenolpyruvate mutase family protein (plasmid) [Paraburkholderia sp. PREW-6R]|uniref:isocitrate lyase/PEP mutase family protein n=1 Tax=Paraburkholderia sp. PREW-6R TaxID=3141544 RepID=UPI0031F59DD9